MKKTIAKKSPAKQVSTKKTPVKKKSPTKKATAKKAPAKKPTLAKKSPAKKPSAKRSPAKKASDKKTSKKKTTVDQFEFAEILSRVCRVLILCSKTTMNDDSSITFCLTEKEDFTAAAQVLKLLPEVNMRQSVLVCMNLMHRQTCSNLYPYAKTQTVSIVE